MHDQPDLPALELLVAVEDEGSLGAAARRVGLAQPNASRTLARLERRCGVPLVVRRSGGLPSPPKARSSRAGPGRSSRRPPG
ncbi:helix-turn-helix domain-containing protein [Arsenicicoccus piscis]|uniref:helix-turn-helix domain-containing protein n=1 Tax=Arsenicicoccus piscis TaxID=673954 RepID=UPI0024E19308|nr:LysR family transcriptional regulator [Arsenicicoccus piscis]